MPNRAGCTARPCSAARRASSASFRRSFEDIRPQLNVSQARAPRQSGSGLPALGSRVRHAKFGAGTVLTVEGQGENARIQINFEEAGPKWLVAGYATLEAE